MWCPQGTLRGLPAGTDGLETGPAPSTREAREGSSRSAAEPPAIKTSEVLETSEVYAACDDSCG